VIGQRRLLEKLGAQALRGDVAQGYEISGPRSIGKHTMALRLAQTLNCAADSRIAGGCGACVACTKIEKGIHPDVLMVTRLVDQIEQDIAALPAWLSDHHMHIQVAGWAGRAMDARSGRQYAQ